MGPSIASIGTKTPQELLVSILDPNREVAPNYVSVLIETTDGQSVLGIPASDLPSGITIRQAYGRETTIPRANIRRMSSDGKSLMPEGLAEAMTPPQRRDLIRFLLDLGRSPDEGVDPLLSVEEQIDPARASLLPLPRVHHRHARGGG